MDLKDWIGRTERLEDELNAAPYAELAATLDQDPARPAPGTALPPLWHWLYFLPRPRRSEIGEDGHAKRGGFLPPVALPRRMWAGGQLVFHRPLKIGQAVSRLSTIESVSEKSGRSGSLVFVKVRHEITEAGAATPALTEHHDIVYREAARPGEAQPAGEPVPATARWEKRWVPDDVLLFRYSALTFNGHRIHYDRRYVTTVEGYPGLIVHGPLLATLMVELVREQLPGRRMRTFSFRGMRPIFDLNAFTVCGEPEGNTVRLWVRDHEGAFAMQGTADVE